MYVAKLKYGLISISKLDAEGFNTNFNNSKVTIIINKYKDKSINWCFVTFI
jgi:hypothetical protein